jgi:hypothetical protein
MSQHHVMQSPWSISMQPVMSCDMRLMTPCMYNSQWQMLHHRSPSPSSTKYICYSTSPLFTAFPATHVKTSISFYVFNFILPV